MKTEMKFGEWRRAILVLLLSMPMLVACAKSSVPVSLHGVNYSANTFSYVVADPADPENRGGGELIEPFSAGGTFCCYTLPAKWRAGIKIEIQEIYWLPKLPDGTLPEVRKKHIVDLPPYVNGKAGELWVVRAADGSMAIVSSNFQPDHVNWPGLIKGWPVPSLEYQRERHDLYVKHAESSVRLYIDLLKELEESPQKNANEAWTLSAKYEPEELKGFSGPDDSAYLAMLKRDYEASLIRAREALRRERAARP